MSHSSPLFIKKKGGGDVNNNFSAFTPDTLEIILVMIIKNGLKQKHEKYIKEKCIFTPDVSIHAYLPVRP